MSEKVLMKGNEAIAEAAIRAGCRHYFGYPITPQTEIAAYMAKRMPKIGGVFLTMANDTNFRKDIVAGVKENFGKHLPVLDAVIPATVRLAEISTADKSIFRHEPRGRAAAAYGALVKEVERIGEKQRIRDADITR